jgi:hypothetical protein
MLYGLNPPILKVRVTEFLISHSLFDKHPWSFKMHIKNAPITIDQQWKELYYLPGVDMRKIIVVMSTIGKNSFFPCWSCGCLPRVFCCFSAQGKYIDHTK